MVERRDLWSSEHLCIHISVNCLIAEFRIKMGFVYKQISYLFGHAMVYFIDVAPKKSNFQLG